MYMYVISGQNSHNFNVSSMPKINPCELSVEALSEHSSSAHNRIGTCRLRRSRSTHVLSSAGSFMPNQVSCHLILAEHKKNWRQVADQVDKWYINCCP